MGLEDVSVLEERAEDHWEATLRLIEADDEWAAVTAFYSCYQLARAALLSDPIFNDFSALKDIHENLTPDDRAATKHNAHRPGRPDFGVVDLVQALYKYMGGAYRTLHRGSVSVRYYRGLEKPLTMPLCVM